MQEKTPDYSSEVGRLQAGSIGHHPGRAPLCIISIPFTEQLGKAVEISRLKHLQKEPSARSADRRPRRPIPGSPIAKRTALQLLPAFIPPPSVSF